MPFICWYQIAGAWLEALLLTATLWQALRTCGDIHEKMSLFLKPGPLCAGLELGLVCVAWQGSSPVVMDQWVEGNVVV